MVMDQGHVYGTSLKQLHTVYKPTIVAVPQDRTAGRAADEGSLVRRTLMVKPLHVLHTVKQGRRNPRRQALLFAKG